MLLEQERIQVVEYGKRMSADRLSTGTSGNISVYNKEQKLMAISPSGMDYFETKPEDIVVMDLDYHVVDGQRKPSSEVALHTEFYRAKPDAGAIVHTHSTYCTTFAALRQPIKAVHYALADAGATEVACADYETFGTMELARSAVKAAGKANAVLLANHGLIVCGTDIKSAYSLACNMEYVAELQYRTMCIGQPVILERQEMERILEKFKSYGQ